MPTVEHNPSPPRPGLAIAKRAAVWLIQLLLAGFFGFVGYMKSFASMTDLESWHAWTSRLPPVLARGVGWSEILCAIGLVLPGLIRRRERLISWSALFLAVNQSVAIAFHAQRGELGHALAQNLVLMALSAVVWRAWRDASTH